MGSVMGVEMHAMYVMTCQCCSALVFVGLVFNDKIFLHGSGQRSLIRVSECLILSHVPQVEVSYVSQCLETSRDI